MTDQPLDAPDKVPVLLSAGQWAQQEALSFIASTMKANFERFTNERILEYVALQRKAQTSVKALDAESARFKADFKSTYLTILKQELKRLTGDDVDPEKAWIYTRYREFKEQRTPLDVLSGWINPDKVSEAGSRTDRALDQSEHVDRLHSISLWDAACANFGFSADSIFLKPFSFVEASFIRYGKSEKTIDVRTFIAIVRRLDLGTALSNRLSQAMGPDGALKKLIANVACDTFELELLEAYRNSAVSGVTRRRYLQLREVFKGKLSAHVHLTQMARTTLSLDDFIPIPLFLIHFSRETGGYSYFPGRPGGGLLFHPTLDDYKQHFIDQLKQAHQDKNMGWFASYLPLTELRHFQRLVTDEPRPAGLSWLAGVLYDGFHAAFPEPSLNTVAIYPDPVHEDQSTLPQMLSAYPENRYKADFRLLAKTRSDADWQALKDAMLAIGQEVLSLLMTPVPGGLSSLNRVLQVVILGALSYSLVKGVYQASQGESNEFAHALLDTADLLISGGFIGVGGKIQRMRMSALWGQLGQPRKVIFKDGQTQLWRPELDRYSQVDASTLNSLAPNVQGIYDINSKLYVKVRYGEAYRAVEVIYDADSKHYVMKTQDTHAYRPAVRFDVSQQVWRLELDSVDHLSDAQLLQRMMPFDASDMAIQDIELMLRITGTTRDHVLNVWQGQRLPGPLADGVRRLRVDHTINRIIDKLPLRGEIPAHADPAIFALLVQLPKWPADTVLDVFDPQGVRVESYGLDPRARAQQRSIGIKRLDSGRYVAKADETQGAASAEQLFTLIIDQLPVDSELGREGSPTVSKTSRIASIREQIALLAKREHILLFKALTVLQGHQRSDSVVSLDPAKKFLPLVCPPFSTTSSALMAKLHALNPLLSGECLEQLLVDHPFTPFQASVLLNEGRAPVAFAEAAGRLKVQLRVDQTLDAIYHSRAYSADTDQWAREFAKGLLRDVLDRQLVISEYGDPKNAKPYVPTGPEDTALELRHYGDGIYRAYDFQRNVDVPALPTVDSFYLAMGSMLVREERILLGMKHGYDVEGLRQRMGNMMSSMRLPNGKVMLWENSVVQFALDVRLPNELEPDGLGLYELNGKKYLPLNDAVYEVELDTTLNKWRMKHPDKVGVDAPELERNPQGAWRISTEDPSLWEGLTLLRRLRTTPVTFNDEVGRQIMQVSNTDEAVLRQVHMNNFAAPPLLMDTWKRFDTEAEIEHFVNSMQEHYSLRKARTDIPLLLLPTLQGWPLDKVLHVVDAKGKTLAECGSDLSPDVPRVKIVLPDANRSDSFLRALLTPLSKEETQWLLGSYDPSIEERMLMLAKKIAAHALKHKARVFNALYEKKEQSLDPHVQLVQQHPSKLPLSVIKNLLSHTSRHERTEYLDKGDLAPRLLEQIPWSTREVRLTRAYEGLFLGSAPTPDSEKLTLRMLQALPGWPGNVSIDMRIDSVNGPVLDTIGSAEAGSRQILVKHDNQYLAYSPAGLALNSLPESGNNLLASILTLLSDDERKAIGIQSIEDTQVLAAKISDLAIAHREQVKTLLGLERPKPWLKPPIEVDVSFITYPLFPRLGRGPHSNQLAHRAARLYPSLTVDEITLFLNTLGANEASRQIELERLRVEYETLKRQLDNWTLSMVRPVSPGYISPVSRAERVQVAARILSAWRRETPRVFSHDGYFIGFNLDLSNLMVGDLPALRGDFRHVGALQMDGMELYSGSNEFLDCFTELRRLSMANNQLSAPPASALRMTGLRRLMLNNTRIVLADQEVQQLRRLTELRVLNLERNPLGLAPDVTLMTHLRFLFLRHTRITTWPVGLLKLTHIERVDLRNNLITSIPPAVFELPEVSPVNRSTALHDNPIDAQSLEQLRAYRERSGGLGSGVQREHVEAPISELEALAAWLPHELSVEERTNRAEQWDLLIREGQVAEDFFKLLNDLTQSREYASLAVQLPLRTRVWSMIEHMSHSVELRTNVFEAASHERVCAGGAVVIFDDLDRLVQIHTAEHLEGEGQAAAFLLNQAKKMFRLRQVDLIAQHDITDRKLAGKRVDEAEIKRFYRVKLARELELPISSNTLDFEPTVGTEQQLKAAKLLVLSMDGTSAMQSSIIQEGFWRSFLQRKYAQRFKALENDFVRASDVFFDRLASRGATDYLRQSQETLTKKEQAIEALFNELTRNEQFATRSIAQ